MKSPIPILGPIALLACSWALIAGIAALNPNPGASATLASARDLHAAAIDHIKIENRGWQAGGFGTVGLFSFRIINENDVAVKDVEIGCVTHAASGTELDRKIGTLYQHFNPHTSRNVTNFNIGLINSQAKSAGCYIIGASIEGEH